MSTLDDTEYTREIYTLSGRQHGAFHPDPDRKTMPEEEQKVSDLFWESLTIMME